MTHDWRDLDWGLILPTLGALLVLVVFLAVMALQDAAQRACRQRGGVPVRSVAGWVECTEPKGLR